ncbi:MAG: hypothetical protein ACI4IN_06370 [Eubacterium sp.]
MPHNSTKKENIADIVVVGCNYCNLLTMARSLGGAGYGVRIVRVFKHKPTVTKPLRSINPEARSKYVTHYTQCLTGGDGAVLVDYLVDYADDRKLLLIPVDDFTVEAVDCGYDALSRHYILPGVGNQGGGIVQLMNKATQKELASRCGLPVLGSHRIASHDGEFTIPDDIRYPCFAKPNVSTKHTKDSMKKCDSYQQLQTHLDSLAAKGDIDILVEDFVDIDTEFSVLGMCVDGSAQSLGAIRIVEGGTHGRKGVALVGETVEVSAMPDIVSGCNALVESMGYDGMFDIDLIRTKDGRIYFVELNFRAGASTYAVGNLPQMYADRVLMSQNTPFVPNRDITFVSEKVLMEEYARGDLSLNRVRRIMEGKDLYFVKDANDPLPYKYCSRFYLVAAAMRLIYKLK